MKTLSLLLAIAFILGLMTPVLADDQGAQMILKQGIVGAAVGGIAASASGGKAGKGALIGAGTNIAGNVIMDALTSGPQRSQRPVQQVMPVQQVVPVRTVQVMPVQPTVPDLYQQGYSAGYQQGFDAGYERGYQAGLAAARR